MKLQLFVTLFVYFVYHCSFAKVADGPDEFCDEGPPGNYCLPDLTGWHNCYVDQKTGQMVDKITTCPPNTRCATFWFIESKCQGSWRTGRRLSNGGNGGGGGGGEVEYYRASGGGGQVNSIDSIVTLPKWMVLKNRENILTRSVFGLSSFPKARKSYFCPALVMKKYFF